jgi:ketosteroid isomerase-like protein
MTTRFTLIAAFFLQVACGFQESSSESSGSVSSDDLAPLEISAESDLAAINALVADWVEMWNSYDLDQVGRLFLGDDRLTYFSSEKEGLIRGMEAVLEHHRGFGFVPGGGEKSSRLWMEDVGIDLMRDAATVTGIWYFQADSDSGPQRGPVTIVCLRTGSGWRFVHMNFSEYPGEESHPR